MKTQLIVCCGCNVGYIAVSCTDWLFFFIRPRCFIRGLKYFVLSEYVEVPVALELHGTQSPMKSPMTMTFNVLLRKFYLRDPKRPQNVIAVVIYPPFTFPKKFYFLASVEQNLYSLTSIEFIFLTISMGNMHS